MGKKYEFTGRKYAGTGLREIRLLRDCGPGDEKGFTSEIESSKNLSQLGKAFGCVYGRGVLFGDHPSGWLSHYVHAEGAVSITNKASLFLRAGMLRYLRS